MLYGNLIFIKKTGGDGSRYPVTEKNIKIGRSENCLIRIYNPQVAPEHCQLIIDCNGQAKLRNLFTPTILNGKPLGQGDVTLCHGDVFKLGERLARWEYLPTSKYFRQLLSPTGRLVAVVNPQRRSMETSGATSEVQASVPKSSGVGNKRKLSEKLITEGGSVAKQRKTIHMNSPLKTKIDLSKLLIGRHSFKGGKLLLKTPTIKQRKSVSAIISSKTSKEKLRKSTLPSWKVNDYAEQNGSIQNKKSPVKEIVKTPSKRSLKNEVRTPSKSTPIKAKTPKRLKTDQKTADKSSLNTILESPQPESVKTIGSFNESPTQVSPTPRRKSTVEAVRLVQSEKKPRTSLKTPKSNKSSRKMSLVLKTLGEDRRISLPQINGLSVRKSAKGKISKSEFEKEVEVPEETSNLTSSCESSANDKPLRNSDAAFTSSKQTRKKSVKNTPVKTPGKFSKSSNQSSTKKATEEIPQTPLLIDFSDEGDSRNTKRTSRELVISSRKSLQKSIRKSAANSLDIFQTPKKSLKEVVTPVLGKTGKEPSRSGVVLTTPRSRKSGNVTTSKKAISSSKKKGVSPKGVRRRLSPSISSAERAAKKLKTSSPKKPDKNKRAALLVLGKASRKHLLSQNVKVLLKQKIVKKAIKQSVPIAKVENKVTSVKKNKKALTKKKKNTAKISKTTEVSLPTRISQSQKESPVSNKPMEKSINEPGKINTSVKKSPERNNKSKLSSPASPAKLTTPISSSVKTPVKSPKKNESILSTKSTNENISPSVKVDNSSESYLFSSNRRCSKRLSSKNDTERPDFVELSPTALGLIPKNIEIFKTPKNRKRKSSSLVTPRNVRTAGIIKSASTSKIGNRKSVTFSSQNLSMCSLTNTPNVNEKTDFDFDSFHTSNITMDVFVSPLNKTGATPVNEFGTDENMRPSERKRSTSSSKKVVRKLLHSPQTDTAGNLADFEKIQQIQTNQKRKSPKNDLSDVSGMKKLFKTPEVQKSPKNDLSDVKGVKQLLRTPKVQKSPKNDLSDVKGVKKLLATPKAQNSPKNDLTDVRGVKQLLRTPKVQKSPKNDLSDVRGVKKLLGTPKVQKSPKNDLSDVRGVKKLLGTPKVQKSPKNDLSDVRGVKKLLTTPKVQKSPKNDLSDVAGVKQLLKTPKVQKSPKNDLSDVRGIKKLLRTPKVQKSPKNDLSDVRGVKKLLGTPKVQKSPKNDLSDVRGVKKLLGTPKVQNSPKNDLTDVRGVKQLLRTPKVQKSPKNDLSDVRGVKKLLTTPKVQKSPKNDLSDVAGVKQLLKTPKTQKSPKNDLSDVEGVQELFASPEPQKNAEVVRSKINRTSGGPKNDLSDVTGVRELFARHKPISNYNVSLTGVAELFDTIETEKEKDVSEQVISSSPPPSETKPGRGRARRVTKKEEEIGVTTEGRTRKGLAEVKERVTRGKKVIQFSDTEDQINKETAGRSRKATRDEAADVVKKVARTRTRSRVQEETPKVEAAQTSRKKKAVEAAEASPPKLRRKATASKQPDLEVESVGTKRVRSKTLPSEEKDTAESIKTPTGKSNTPAKRTRKVQTKATRSGTKSVSKTAKVQKSRSQTGVKQESTKSEDLSPRKTRSASAKKTRTAAAGKKK